jgi:iron(III) transport system permease protein
VWAAVGLFAGLPLAALAWKAGGGGTPAGWTAAGFVSQVRTVLAADGRTLAGSLAAALGVGLVAGLLAWPACWLAGSSRWFTRFLFGLCVVLWLTPGPVVGFGLLEVIDRVVTAEAWVLDQFGLSPTFPPLRSALYDQPSAVPAAWAGVVRLFPVAVVVLWPAVRAVPRELLDAAKLDGFGPAGQWRLAVGPLTWPAFVRAVFGVSALALGEVSAGKVVNPPGYMTYVHRLFDQMHYGAESTVAALALVQITVTTTGAILLMRAVSGEPRRG